MSPSVLAAKVSPLELKKMPKFGLDAVYATWGLDYFCNQQLIVV